MAKDEKVEWRRMRRLNPLIYSTIQRSSSTLGYGEDKNIEELDTKILKTVIIYTLKASFFLLSFLLSLFFFFFLSLFSFTSFFLVTLTKISLARLEYTEV